MSELNTKEEKIEVTVRTERKIEYEVTGVTHPLLDVSNYNAESEQEIFDKRPPPAYGYKLIDIKTYILPSGQVIGAIKDKISPMSYWGERLTLDEIPDNSHYKILRENMQVNHCDACHTIRGNYVLLCNTDDKVLNFHLLYGL